MSRFFKWGSSSLLGHIVLSEVFFTTPLSIMFFYSNYTEGELTVSWALYIAFMGALLGVVGAMLLWYLVSLPLIKERGGR